MKTKSEIIQNMFYKKEYITVNMFNKLMYSTKIYHTENNTFSKLDFIKYIKDYNGYGLYECVQFINLLEYIGFIFNSDYNKYSFNDNFDLINDIKQIKYLIDNDSTINYYVRNLKLKKLLNE